MTRLLRLRIRDGGSRSLAYRPAASWTHDPSRVCARVHVPQKHRRFHVSSTTWCFTPPTNRAPRHRCCVPATTTHLTHRHVENIMPACVVFRRASKGLAAQSDRIRI